MRTAEEKKPLVYSCSGCSSIAQMANAIAIGLDRDGVADMSCIAGVGGDVPSLVKLAKSGRYIVALDGCPLHCVKSCLSRHGIAPDVHYTLSDMGAKKKYHMDFDVAEAKEITVKIASDLVSNTKPLSSNDTP